MSNMNDIRVIFVREDLKRKLENLLNRLTEYNVITFDKGDAQIMLIHGIHVLLDEEALRILTHLAGTRNGLLETNGGAVNEF